MGGSVKMGNTAEVLIQDIYQRGVILKVEDNDLLFKPQSRMTPELLGRLRNHKTEVISKLTTPVGVTETPKTIEKRTGFADRDSRNPPSDGISVLRPGHPLSDFDHDSVFGSPPRYVQHKYPNCESTEFWKHRWGSFHCSACWPCKDAIMQIETDDKPEPNPEPGNQAEHHREWTSEEESLIYWFNQNFDSHPTENFQHEINLAGLQQQLHYGPAYRDSGKVIADIRLLKADPERFHDLLEQRHQRDLNQWKPRYKREK